MAAAEAGAAAAPSPTEAAAETAPERRRPARGRTVDTTHAARPGTNGQPATGVHTAASANSSRSSRSDASRAGK